MKLHNSYITYFSNGLVFLTLISFWVMYGVISYYNRFATDDYAMIAIANHKGIVGGTVWFYFNWSGGIFCSFFEIITVYLLQNGSSLLIYNLFLIAFVSGSLFFLAHEFVLLYGFPISILSIFILTQLFIQALFFSGFSIAENWFWLIGSNAYIYPLCFIFVSIACLLHYKRTTCFIYFLTSLLLVFVFGSYPVNYVVFFGLMYLLYMCNEYYHSGKFSSHNLIYLHFFLCGAALNILAPGNYKRLISQQANMVAQNVYPFFFQIWHIPVFIVKNIIQTKYVFILVFTFPIAYLSFETIHKLKLSLSRKVILKMLFTFLTLFMFSLFLNTIIFYKAYGYGVSFRSMLHINIFLLLLCTTGFLLVFTEIVKKISFVFYLSLFLCIYLNFKTLINQYPIVTKYAQKHDERTNQILKAIQNFEGNVLYLDSLPDSGILLNAEISQDTSHYINSDMKSRFELPFALAVK